MSVLISGAVWKYSKATATDLLVLLALADQADDQGECWPSMGYIGKKCRIDTRTARRHIRQLEELGEVIVVLGGGKASAPGSTRSNRYRIVVHIPATEGGNLPDSTDGGNLPEADTGVLLSRARVSGRVGQGRPHNRQLPVSDPENPLTPTTDVVGATNPPKNSRAHGTNPRALRVKETEENRVQDDLDAWWRLGRDRAALSWSVEELLDHIDHLPRFSSAEQRQAALDGFAAESATA